MSGAAYVYPEYERIQAMDCDDDGNLRLYRRRGLFGILRRVIFHPAGSWVTVKWQPSGNVQVTIWTGRDAP